MKRILLVLMAGLLLAGCKDDKPAASGETSPGGIAYSRIYLPEAEDVVIRIAWPTDWAQQEDVNQATPYIGADLVLAGGAKGYSAGDAGEVFADLDAEAGLSVTVDHILGALVAPKENIAEVVRVANAHLRTPLLDDQWLARIRGGFANRMAETRARPDSQGSEALRWAVFGDSPIRAALSLDVPGMIGAVTRDDVMAWHAQIFTRNQAIIVIAGALDEDAAGQAIDALLDGLPDAAPVSSPVISANFTPRRILLHLPDAQTSSLTFVGPLPPTAEGGELQDFILATALGGGENSVLFTAVRSDLRASYGFGAGLDGFSRTNRFLALRGQVETGKIAEAEAVVRDAYAGFREAGPEGALADLKAPFVANFQQSRTRPGSVSLSALMAVLDGSGPQVALSLGDLLEKISEGSLRQRLQQAFPQPDRFIVLAVSPDANALPGACVITKPEQAITCK